MGTRSVRRLLASLAGAGLFLGGAATAGSLASAGPPGAEGMHTAAGQSRVPLDLPAFSQVVNLSHVNDPMRTPLFPGDPAFRITTAFTVAEDGFYLEVVREGTHTGTHYSAPCHFHEDAACMDDLSPADLVLPAVVVDMREAVLQDPDHKVRIADLMAWEAEHGEMPSGAAVLLWTGCSRFWAMGDVDGEPSYYNCGSGLPGVHQPGFSRHAVRWLIETGVLAERGALGTDTFGPDPSSDASFTPTWLTLRRHRVTIENIAHLGELPPVGAWIVLGSPRNVNGSGAPGTVVALVP